jgi:hypothetical protein
MNENMMEYPKSDEEFYLQMSSTLEEIYSLPVSFEEKRNLQYLTYETMGRYEEQKKCKIENEKNFKKLGESLGQLERSFYQMRENIGKINEAGRIALINAQIASAKMKDAVKLIHKTGKAVIETTRGLQRKLEAKNTLVEITMGMVGQKPKNKN